MSNTKRKTIYSIGGISLLLLCLLFLFTTGLTFNKKHPAEPSPSLASLLENMSSKQVNLNDVKNPFSKGTYYEYTGGTATGDTEEVSSRRFSHPELILGYIAGQGADLKEAWYRSYSSSCSPPGSNMAMDVIVPAKLLIRLGQPLSDSKRASMGLKEVENPSLSACPYYVRHYSFVKSGK